MTEALGVAGLVACVAALLATGVLVVDRRARGLTDRALGTLVWGAGLLIAYVLALSLGRVLTASSLLVLSAAGAGVAAALRPRRLGEPDPPPARALRGAHALAAAALGLVTAGFCAASAGTMLVAPEPYGDNVVYHLPRIGYWINDRAVHPFLANNPRIGVFPPNGNILQMLPILYLRSDRLAAAAQLVAGGATALAIFGLGRRLGAPGGAAALAAFMWFTVPAALEQMVLSNVDLVLACFGTVAVYFLVDCLRTGSRFAAVTALLSAGVAAGTKPQAFVLAAIVSLAAGGSLYRRARLRPLAPLALGGALAAFVALTFYLQNVAWLGHPAGLAAVSWLHVNPGVQTFVRNAVLVFALPVYWLWTPAAPFDTAVPAQTLRGALTENGLGVLWPLFALAAALWVGWRSARSRGRDERMACFVLAVGLVYLAATLGSLRHQPAVSRFCVAVVPLLTAPGAVLLRDLWGRSAAAALVTAAFLVAPGLYVLAFHARHNLSVRVAPEARHRLVRTLKKQGRLPVRTEYTRFTPALAAMAEAIDRLSGPRGIRIGLLTDQFTLERIALGNRYQNRLVPLSYTPPASVAELDRLGLDALWIHPALPPRLMLFRPRFEGAPEPHEEGWRVTEFRGFDGPFLHAHGEAVFWQDLSGLVFGLAGDVPWRIVVWNEAGALLAPGRESTVPPRVVGIFNPNGMETFDGVPFFWVGEGTTMVVVARGTARTAVLEAEFNMGPSLPGVRSRRLRIFSPGSIPRDIVLQEGPAQLSIPLPTNVTLVLLNALDRPTRAALESGDRRPMLIGVKGLTIRAQEDGAP